MRRAAALRRARGVSRRMECLPSSRARHETTTPGRRPAMMPRPSSVAGGSPRPFPPEWRSRGARGGGRFFAPGRQRSAFLYGVDQLERSPDSNPSENTISQTTSELIRTRIRSNNGKTRCIA